MIDCGESDNVIEVREMLDKSNTKNWFRSPDILWKFVKELVILFHQISAAPWGHMVSTIKRAPPEDSSSFFHSHRC